MLLRKVEMNKHIEALLTERAGYVARNLTKRVEAVDAALREIGFEHKYMTPEPEVEVAISETATETAALKRGKKK